jgi:hypothetical protein
MSIYPTTIPSNTNRKNTEDSEPWDARRVIVGDHSTGILQLDLFNFIGEKIETHTPLLRPVTLFLSCVSFLSNNVRLLHLLRNIQ